MSAAPLLVVLLPLVLAAFVTRPGGAGRLARAAAPWAALPALLLALWPHPPPPAEYPSVLTGMRIEVDATGHLFLLLTAFLWTVAGVYARAYHAEDPARPRLYLFWLAALCGNLGLTVAGDVVTFYLFFALMTFAAYGLVVHAGGGAALRAGRVYLVMAVLGEAMLLSGIVLGAADAAGTGFEAFAAAVADSPRRDLVVGLLLAGFGVKAGAVPLHVWLPLAHPVAPTSASAVLSGSMIKAGLLGWLRFLPLGHAALPGWGAALVALGLAAAFLGVLAGAAQRDAKTALAYSSISQMGFLNVAVGVGLASPQAWPYAWAAALAYALHHGLAKGALFLGVGVAAAARGSGRLAAMAGLAVAALAVAGAPATSGSLAKSALKGAAAQVPQWPAGLDLALSLAAVGTTVLMGRFLLLVWRAGGSAPGPAAGLAVPWMVLLGGVAGVLWWVPGHYQVELGGGYGAGGWVPIWPLAAGGVLLWVLVLGARTLRVPPERVAVSPGDLVVPVERGLSALRRAVAVKLPAAPDAPGWIADRWHGIYARGEQEGRAARLERRLGRWGAAAALFVAVAVALAAALAAGGAR
jgi:formate hydrogenlyase subunit 3/multisubunit Na+/H+ antiporter MnhD subunit